MTNPQVAALAQICRAVTDSVAAAGPLGAPGGVIYATLSAQGCTLANYQALMAALVEAGKLRREGELYFVVSA